MSWDELEIVKYSFNIRKHSEVEVKVEKVHLGVILCSIFKQARVECEASWANIKGRTCCEIKMLFSSRIKIPWIPQETGCAKRTSQFSVDPASSYQFNFPTSSREHFQISPHFDCQVRSLSGIRWWLRPLTPHDPPSSSSDTDETWIAAKKEILEMENFFFFRSFHIEVIDYFSHSLLLCLSLSLTHSLHLPPYSYTLLSLTLGHIH